MPISETPTLGKSIVGQSKLSFTAIGPLFFEDISGTVLENDFVLTFFARGFLMNHGVLKFGPAGSKEPTLAIAFPGYMQPFVLQSVNSYSLPGLKEQSEIERVTEATRQELDYTREDLPLQENLPKRTQKDTEINERSNAAKEK